METAEFGELFKRHLVEPAAAVGFTQWGHHLWFESGPLTIVVLRSDRRSISPFDYTLALGHSFLRGFKEGSTLRGSQTPHWYPIKIKPSETPNLVKRFNYTPYGYEKFPTEPVEGKKDLKRIAKSLEAVKWLQQIATPEKVLAELELRGTGGWDEQRWLADYRSHLGR